MDTHSKTPARLRRLSVSALVTAVAVLLPYAPVLAGPQPGDKTAVPATDPLSTGSMVQMFAGLALVLGLVFLLAWAMRRFGRLSVVGNRSLRVVGALSMGTRERVVLIQAGETQLLVGVAPGRVQTLHVLDKPIEPAAGGDEGGGFAQRLRQVMARGGGS
jgi:flagellar protein FliO/FliZ